MEETDLIVCDTDILIEFLDRKNEIIKKRLEEFGVFNICFSSVTASELIFGSADKKHHLRLSTFISNSIVIPIDKEISDLHFELVKNILSAIGSKFKMLLLPQQPSLLSCPYTRIIRKILSSLKDSS